VLDSVVAPGRLEYDPARPRGHLHIDVPGASARWTKLTVLDRAEAAHEQARRVLFLGAAPAEPCREAEGARCGRALRRVPARAGHVVSRETFLRTCLRGGEDGDGRGGRSDEAGGRESVSESKFAAGGDRNALKRKEEARSSQNMRCLRARQLAAYTQKKA
jgi:hypothetical protein